MLVGFPVLASGSPGCPAVAPVAYGMGRARSTEVERDRHADEDPVERLDARIREPVERPGPGGRVPDENGPLS